MLLDKIVYPGYISPIRLVRVMGFSEEKTPNNDLIQRNGHEINVTHYYREMYGIELK